MKTLYTLFLIFFCFLQLVGQNNCENNVSTNPLAPTNNSLPANLDNLRYLNGFDWNARDQYGYLSYYQLENMLYNQNMLNIMDDQSGGYYNYITQGEQMSFINGWELLLMNIGRYPNLENYGQTLAHSDLPYLIFYNRYNGMIRVFANFGNGALPTGIFFDAVMVELKFNSNTEVNGILRLNEGMDQALDKTTNVKSIKGIAKHPNSPGNWFSVDLNVSFDPCICYYESKMQLDFHFITFENIELFGRSISIDQDLIQGSLVKDKDFLTSFNNKSGDSKKGGIIMYETMNQMVDDYLVKLEAYKLKLANIQEQNAKVERNLAIIKLFKNAVLDGAGFGISAIINKEWFGDAIQWTGEFIGQDSIVKQKELIKQAKSALADGVNTLITKNFTKQSEPQSPNKPMATFTEMYISGSTSDTLSIIGPVFYTPGTYGSEKTGSPLLTSYFHYPLYNESLGIFSLLKSPKIRISKTVQDINDKREARWVQEAFDLWSINAYLYQNWTKNYQFKLAEDLEYALNTRLDIENVDIEAAFRIIAKPLVKHTNFHPLTRAYNDPNYTTNVFSSILDPTDFSKIYGYTTPIYSDEFVNGNDQFYSEYFSIPKSFDPDTVLIYTTDYLPIDNFFNHVGGLGIKNEEVIYSSTKIDEKDPNYPIQDRDKSWIFPQLDTVPHKTPSLLDPMLNGIEYTFEVELKLKVDILFSTINEQGDKNSVTQLLTYKIDPISNFESTDIVFNLKQSSSNIGQYPKDLTFLNTNFNGADISGCKLTNNHYSCKAWSSVTIQGELSVSTGYNVDIIAGTNIEQLPETQISPEINLSILPILDATHPMSQATPSEVSFFCKGNSGNAPAYKASILSKALWQEIDSLHQIENLERLNISPFSFQLFPNPACNNATVILEGPGSKEARISVFDLSGKEMQVRIEANENRYNLDVAHLAKGLYFVKVSTFGEAQTKQLVIQ